MRRMGVSLRTLWSWVEIKKVDPWVHFRGLKIVRLGNPEDELGEWVTGEGAGLEFRDVNLLVWAVWADHDARLIGRTSDWVLDGSSGWGRDRRRSVSLLAVSGAVILVLVGLLIFTVGCCSGSAGSAKSGTADDVF